MATRVVDKLDFDVTDKRFAIDKLHPDNGDTMLFWARAMTLYEERAKFWKPALTLADQCARYTRREIFTENQKDVYKNKLNKIPMEPQEIKPIVNSLMRAIKRRVNPGTVGMEDDNPPPDRVAKPEVAALVLKWSQQHVKLPRRQLDAGRTGLSVCYPQCVWFDKVTREGGLTTDLQVTLLPWKTVLPSAWFAETDGSDIEDVMFGDYRSKKQMLDAFPDRAKAVKRHQELMQDPGYYVSVLNEINAFSSSDRPNILGDQIMAQTHDSMNGRYFIITHAFPVETKETVWYSSKQNRAVRFPEEWEQWRKEMWLNTNPDFDERHRLPVKTLWVTVVGGDGFVWFTGPSWYQENGELPCAWFIPDMVDGVVTGVTADLIPYVFAKAVSMTEGLDQVRKGTGSVTFIKEGRVRHPASIGDEMTKPDGVVFLKGNDTRVEDAVAWRERKPNTAYLEYEDRIAEQMKDVHHVHPAMTGAFGGRQSFKAKQMEREESMGPQSAYVENYQSFVYACNNRLCSMWPYWLNEARVIEIEDEFGKRQRQQINQRGYDYSGQAQIIANDLLSARYRYVPKPSDDSELAREEQMKEFLEMLSAIGNTLLQKAPRIVAGLLMKWPNRYAHQAGEGMLEASEQVQQAEAAAAQTEAQRDAIQQQARTVTELMKLVTPRMMLKTDAADIADNPEGFKLFYEWYLSQQQQAQNIAQHGLQLGQAMVPQQQQQPQPQIPAPQPPGGAEQPQPATA